MKCDPKPTSLMVGYMDDPERTARCFAGGYYRTGDVAHRDADGYFTYVGRADDVFKSSDYRLSPFELESALIEHDCVAEAAVVPSPDAIRWNVPKAFITLKPGVEPTADLAREIFKFTRTRLGPFKRIRRSNFPTCPRPSPARFAACSCAASNCIRAKPAVRASIGKRISPISKTRHAKPKSASWRHSPDCPCLVSTHSCPACAERPTRWRLIPAPYTTLVPFALRADGRVLSYDIKEFVQ